MCLTEGEGDDVNRGQIQLATGKLAQRTRALQLAGAGALENRGEFSGRLVDYLGYFQNLLRASHGPHLK